MGTGAGNRGIGEGGGEGEQSANMVAAGVIGQVGGGAVLRTDEVLVVSVCMGMIGAG